MFLGHRSNDPTLTITQDNARKTIIINEINAAAEELLGFQTADIVGKPLLFLLPERIGNLLEDYVEYDPDGNDVSAVLSKVQSFCLINKQRKEVSFRVKIHRMPSDVEVETFRLVLQNPSAGRRDEAFRSILRENFKGHEILDAATQLPDRGSIAKDIEFALFYVHKGELKASVAVCEVLNFYTLIRERSDVETYAAFRHAADVIRRNLRPDDMIGFLAPKRLCLILFDTTPESSRMVLNRLRWLIAANVYIAPDDAGLPLNLSIGFTQLQPSMLTQPILQSMEDYMDSHSLKENSIDEIVLGE